MGDPVEADVAELEAELDQNMADAADAERQVLDQLEIEKQAASSQEQKAAIQAEIETKQVAHMKDLIVSFKLSVGDPEALRTALLDPTPPTSVPPEFQALDQKLNDTGKKTANLMDDIAKRNGEALSDILRSEEAWKGSKTYKELSDKGMSEASKNRLWQLLLLALAGGLGYLALWAWGKHESGCYIVDSSSGTDRQLTTDGNCNCCNNATKCDAQNTCCGISCPSSSTVCYCKQVSAFDALGGLLQTVVNLVTSTGQGISDIIKKILLYVGIGIGILILIKVMMSLFQGKPASKPSS